jgi:hypothetical protein
LCQFSGKRYQTHFCDRQAGQALTYYNQTLKIGGHKKIGSGTEAVISPVPVILSAAKNPALQREILRSAQKVVEPAETRLLSLPKQ